jgi:hypothetical protein
MAAKERVDIRKRHKTVATQDVVIRKLRNEARRQKKTIWVNT